MNVKKAVYRELVKTDKYGNETYRTNKCRRCGGTGRVFWSGLMGGRCFECAGSGTVEEYRTVVYTPEQERLRDAKRRAKKLGTVAQQYRAQGFGPDGIAYVPMGDTFPIRKALLAIGAHWDSWRRVWRCPVRPDRMECYEVRASDVSTVEHIDEQGFGYDVVEWHFSD